MLKMNEDKIKFEAKKIADSWLAHYSLQNAKKIVREVRRFLLAEEQRRKN